MKTYCIEWVKNGFTKDRKFVEKENIDDAKKYAKENMGENDKAYVWEDCKFESMVSVNA